MPTNERNPFEGVTDFFSELGRMREFGVHGREHVHERRRRTHASAWVPATDVFARDGDLIVRVEVAGAHPDDVEVTFAHGVLTVAGTRDTEPAPEGEDPLLHPGAFSGAFRRALTLPEGTEESQTSAEFANGLVEITVRGAAFGREATRVPLRDGSDGPTRRTLG